MHPQGDHDERGLGRGHVQGHPRPARGRAGHGPGRVQVLLRRGDARHTGSDGRAHGDIRPRVPRLGVECEQFGGVAAERVGIHPGILVNIENEIKYFIWRNLNSVFEC